MLKCPGPKARFCPVLKALLTGIWPNTTCAVLSPDGRRLFTGHYAAMRRHYSGRVWDLAHGRPLSQFAFGLNQYLGEAAFSSDGTKIITGSSQGDVRIWDVRTGNAPEMHWWSWSDMGRPFKR